MRSFTRVQGAQRDGDRVVIRADQATLEVSFFSPSVARVRMVFPGEAPPPGQTVALTTGPGATTVDFADGDPLLLKSPELVVRIEREPFRIRFEDPDGSVVLQGYEDGALSWEAVDEGRRRVQAHFGLALEEHFYGLGEGGAGFDRDGTTRTLWNSHYGRGPGSDVAVPLLLSTRGYGLFFDNSWASRVELGRTEKGNTLLYTAEGGALDLYFLYGPGLKNLLAAYADLTGHAPLPPKWTLGYIQSTRHFERTADILEMARLLREKRIPCDGIVFLSTYGPDKGMNNGVGTLDFQPELWANPGEVIGALKAQDFHVVSHEYPVVGPRQPELYAAAKDRGYLLDCRGAGASVMFNVGQSFIDFTRPEAGDWWWDAHKQLVDLGVDGWWLDGGEGPPAAAKLSKGPGLALHNVFDLNRQRAFHDGERRSRPDLRHWMLCRSGYAGMQRYGSACWSGDINNNYSVFEAQVPLGLNTGMSGIPYWGTDIGGFFHSVPQTGEYHARWFQFAAFCPIFRSHGRGPGFAGWREHLPWAFGPEVEEICRRYAELRYRLLPYTYSLAWQAHFDGLPLMRPLVLEYPDDAHVVDLGSEYLWGPSILVAPVTRGGATRWPAYLPKGTWHDFWTREPYEGGRWVEVEAPLDRLPLFVRAGAIIPTGPAVQHTGDPAASLGLLVYPDGESGFTLYEDDGVTRGYERGEFATTEIHCAATRERIQLTLGATEGEYTGQPAQRIVTAEIRLNAPPLEVSIAGHGPVARLERWDLAAQTAPAWWHDGQGFLWVTASKGRGPLEISLRL